MIAFRLFSLTGKVFSYSLPIIVFWLFLSCIPGIVKHGHDRYDTQSTWSPPQTGWSQTCTIGLLNLGMIDMMHETSGSPTQIGWSCSIEIDAILLLLACVTERKLDKPAHASHGITCHPLWFFGSIHEKHPHMGSTRSMLFPNFGSMISMAEHPPVRYEEWDVESQREGYTSNVTGVDWDDILQTPLISRQTTSLEKDIMGPTRGTFLRMWRNSNLMQRAEAAPLVKVAGLKITFKNKVAFLLLLWLKSPVSRRCFALIPTQRKLSESQKKRCLDPLTRFLTTHLPEKNLSMLQRDVLNSIWQLLLLSCLRLQPIRTLTLQRRPCCVSYLIRIGYGYAAGFVLGGRNRLFSLVIYAIV